MPIKKNSSKRTQTSKKSPLEAVLKRIPAKKPIQKKDKKTDPVKLKKLIRNIAIWTVVFLVSLIIVDYGVQYLNYKASVAIVNGQRIYRKDFYTRLEQIYGSAISNQLVDKELIRQEGIKQNVEVTDQEVLDRIAQWEADYGGQEKFDAELAARNLTREMLQEDLKISMIEEKILGKDITITEDEEKTFYDQYKDVIVPGNSNPTMEEAKSRIDDALLQQKISAKEQQWITDLRAAANIQNNIDDPRGYSFLGITRKLISELFSGKSND